jgi:hypothetical protein
MRIASPTKILLALVIAAVACSASAASARIFTLESDEFWLNLHSFLYVLGRAQNKYPDAQRDAVAAAPGEAERGLAPLTDAERRTWADAVTTYARGPSRQDPTRDQALADLEQRLADRDDARSLADAGIDSEIRNLLERAAPVYRKAWWPAHRASNRDWLTVTQKLVAKHGQAVLGFITRAYAMPWPAGGYAVHVVRYASWGGAYSTGDLFLVSSNPGAGLSGYGGLESAFHEAMHTWDDPMAVLLDTQARAAGVQVARGLSHALVFFTSSEAVRRVAPAGYVTVAESSGVWERMLPGLKAALQETWLPYLNGSGTRDEALAALVRRAAPLAAAPPGSSLQSSPAPALFTFSTDDFWLNLHHFLYAAGVIEARLPDASQPALAPAGPDVERGLQRLDADQRRKWADIVGRYAKEWSLRLPGTDPGTIRALADAGDAPTLAGARVPPALLAALEEAAPIYRAGWWSAHRDGNRASQSQLEPLIARYGDEVRRFVTRAYGVDWPASGRSIRVTAYANFGGAYSLVNGGVIVVSSVDPNSRGLSGLEGIFHESMHQWDPQTFAALGEQAKKINVQVPPDLPHAMIFFTAGQAIREISPDYVPTVNRLGIWDVKLSGSSLPASRLQQPLLDAWQPYLEGRGSREDALALLVAKAAAASTNIAH